MAMAIIIENVEEIEQIIASEIKEEVILPAQENINRINAYSAGSEAYITGKTMKENPFTGIDKKAATEWRKGWLDSRESNENPKPYASIWDSIQNEFDITELED